jgi:hypothetical protein
VGCLWCDYLQLFGTSKPSLASSAHSRYLIFALCCSRALLLLQGCSPAPKERTPSLEECSTSTKTASQAPAPPPSMVTQLTLTNTSVTNTAAADETRWTDADTFQRLLRAEERRFIPDSSLAGSDCPHSSYLPPMYFGPQGVSTESSQIYSPEVTGIIGRLALHQSSPQDLSRQQPPLHMGLALPPDRHQGGGKRLEPPGRAVPRPPSNPYSAPPPQPLNACEFTSYSAWSRAAADSTGDSQEATRTSALLRDREGSDKSVRGSGMATTSGEFSYLLPLAPNTIAAPRPQPLPVVPESMSSPHGDLLRLAMLRRRSQRSSKDATRIKASESAEQQQQQTMKAGSPQIPSPEISCNSSLHADTDPAGRGRTLQRMESSKMGPPIMPPPLQPISGALQLLKSTVRMNSQNIDSNIAAKPPSPDGTLTPPASTDEADLLPPSVGLRPQPNKQLMRVLQRLADGAANSAKQELFAERYAITGKTLEGDQSVVTFARGSAGGFQQYAIKCVFFPRAPFLCNLTLKPTIDSVIDTLAVPYAWNRLDQNTLGQLQRLPSFRSICWECCISFT